MASSTLPLVFRVRRQDPKLLVPSKPTPHELKQLSDIDDQEGFRFQVPVIMFYKNNPSMEGKDPASVIREALAKALVFYYPFAGRLVEGPNRKLSVDCTAEGVLFIEADANVELDRLGDTVGPGCPYLEELLYDVPGSDGIVGCPLLLIQVTRFSCGGFTFAIRLNHTMSDGSGLMQFLNTIAEFAQQPQTKITPSVPPIWQRHLLSARQPPSITCPHHEYDQALAGAATTTTTANKTTTSHHEYDQALAGAAATTTTTTAKETTTIDRSFFFGAKEIRAIRNHLPHHHHSTTATTFELLTACVWQCRTRALCLAPDETVRVSCIVNGRGNKYGLNLPPGYYGNVITYPTAMTKAGMLSMLPLGYALELVKKAKAQVSEEYFRSVADLMVIKGRPLYSLDGNKDYIVSDTTRAGFDKVDFGWGMPVFGGVPRAISLISFFARFRDIRGGEDVIVVPMSLPESVMDRFEQELKKMIHKPISML
ncbi:hypothetical protein TEA_010439 [Camellia sinensis var. sinensis]|uniref:Methanol O-anthraniloyltransferase n=1 Tax=Camellia sinensis var. sinensis TaxID=542762 RepID=A0A4S4DPC0_CAMSN|nr:hypothetical protein TEA_010439 [Camellia sinensis var. sinensis]